MYGRDTASQNLIQRARVERKSNHEIERRMERYRHKDEDRSPPSTGERLSYAIARKTNDYML